MRHQAMTFQVSSEASGKERHDGTSLSDPDAGRLPALAWLRKFAAIMVKITPNPTMPPDQSELACLVCPYPATPDQKKSRFV